MWELCDHGHICSSRPLPATRWCHAPLPRASHPQTPPPCCWQRGTDYALKHNIDNKTLHCQLAATLTPPPLHHLNPLDLHWHLIVGSHGLAAKNSTEHCAASYPSISSQLPCCLPTRGQPGLLRVGMGIENWFHSGTGSRYPSLVTSA